MAVSTPTLLGTVKTFSSASSSVTSDSISPTGDALLVIIFAHRQGGDVNWASSSPVTDTLTGTGTWTTLEGAKDGSSGSDISWAFAKAGSSPGTGTITATLSGNSQRGVCTFFEVTGQHATDPQPSGQRNTTTGTSATPSIALPSGPAAGSLVISAINDRDNSGAIGNGSGETEFNETASGGTSQATLDVQYSTDQTHDWTSVSTSGHSALIFEIVQAAAGGLSIPVAMRTYRGMRL